MVDAETGARGFLLTRNDAALKPYIDAKQEYPAALERIIALVADNPAQHQRLAKLGPSLEDEILYRKLAMPYVGALLLDEICDETLEPLVSALKAPVVAKRNDGTETVRVRKNRTVAISCLARFDKS